MPSGSPTINVSLREAFQVAERALTGMGVPRGCAADAARLVLALELDAGGGLALLDRSLARPFPPAERAARLTADEGAFATIDAQGQSSLCVGPPALDIACAKASLHGLAAVVVVDLAGLAFATALASYARHRGMDALAVCELPGPTGGKGWLRWGARATALTPIEGVASAVLDAVGALLAPTPSSEIDDRLSNAILDDTGRLLLLCTPTSAAGSREGSRSIWYEVRGYGPFLIESPRDGSLTRTVSTGEQRALREGVTVDGALWSRLYEANLAILASMSEGSRGDAGPGTGRPFAVADEPPPPKLINNDKERR